MYDNVYTPIKSIQMKNICEHENSSTSVLKAVVLSLSLFFKDFFCHVRIYSTFIFQVPARPRYNHIFTLKPKSNSLPILCSWGSIALVSFVYVPFIFLFYSYFSKLHITLAWSVYYFATLTSSPWFSSSLDISSAVCLISLFL